MWEIGQEVYEINNAFVRTYYNERISEAKVIILSADSIYENVSYENLSFCLGLEESNQQRTNPLQLCKCGKTTANEFSLFYSTNKITHVSYYI